MKARKLLATALLAGLLPLTAQASTPAAISAEIKREMAGAKTEVRTEMAKAKAELDKENLSLGNSLSFGKANKRKSDNRDLPPAHITPTGDLVIDGKTVAVNAEQRRQLLAYRKQVIRLAKAGIDGGEKAAMAALDATDVSLFSLMFSAMTGSLERRVESLVKQHVLPVVQQICHDLPQVRNSQQALAASVPQFRPYATIEADDYKDCEREIRQELAAR